MRAISLPGSAFWACQLPFGYTSYSLCGAKRAQKWLHVGAFFWHAAHQLSAYPPKQCIMVTRWSSPHTFVLVCSNAWWGSTMVLWNVVKYTKHPHFWKKSRIYSIVTTEMNWMADKTNPSVASEGFGGKRWRLKKVRVCRELHAWRHWLWKSFSLHYMQFNGLSRVPAVGRVVSVLFKNPESPLSFSAAPNQTGPW